MTKLKAFFKKLFASNGFIQIFALIIAFCTWSIVATAVDPNTRYVVNDVPIDASASAALVKQGLSVISVTPAEVKVRVFGPGYVINQLDPQSIKIVPRLSSITGAGTQELRLDPDIPVDAEYTVEAIEPATATVRVDRLDQKTFDIQPNVSGLQIGDGYIKEDEFVTPERVTVTGPLGDLNKIAHAFVNVAADSTLTSTLNASGTIVLVDKDGNVVASEHLTKDNESAEVTIPVLKKREIPLAVSFLNTPPGFPLDSLPYKLSNEVIVVAGPQALVDNYSLIQLGHVDFHRLEPGSRFTYDISLPSGFRNVDNILSASVTFETDDFDYLTLNLDAINVVNAPANYEVQVLNETLRGVRIVGPADTLASLTAADVVAEVDLSDREVVTGQVNAPVRVYVPGKGTVWATGEYSTLVEIAAKR